MVNPALVLAEWPVQRPRDWLAKVNRPIARQLLQRLHESVNRGQPYGEDRWVEKTAAKLHLTHTLRQEGRPRKRRASADNN